VEERGTPERLLTVEKANRVRLGAIGKNGPKKDFQETVGNEEREIGQAGKLKRTERVKKIQRPRREACQGEESHAEKPAG